MELTWLGDARGHLADWTTQRWVQLTGRRVDLRADPWLVGPVGSTRGIGPGYFDTFAESVGLEVRRDGGARGLLPSFQALAGAQFDPSTVHPRVAEFYERTSAFEIDMWSEWCGAFRPFGQMLAWIFSRRLQQLNMPLSGLDTSRGMTSEVLQLVDKASGAVRFTAWVRGLVGTGRLVYAGSYSVCAVPGSNSPCVKVTFPLPNGNAIVFLRPVVHPDGSFSIVSSGERFGDPGFYFTVHGEKGIVWARYLRAMRENIHVYATDDGALRTDHVFRLVGAVFLRMHYRLRRSQARTRPGSTGPV
jgi:hypothetical protein